MTRKIDGFTIRKADINEDCYKFSQQANIGFIASPTIRGEPITMTPIISGINDIIKYVKTELAGYIDNSSEQNNQYKVNKFLADHFEKIAQEELKKNDPNLREVFSTTLELFNSYINLAKKNKEFNKFYPSCDVVGFIDKDNKIQYGYTSNFGVALFRENGKLEFKTDSFKPKNSLELTLKNKQEYKALTENKNSINALTFGQMQIKPGNVFLMYHNELEDMIESEEDMKEAIKNLPLLQSYLEDEVKKEASLIYLKK